MSVSTHDVVVGPSPSRLALLWASYIGKKILMALSGIILFLYVLAHLLGNMQLYLGAEVINRYAKFLHSNEGVLWTARAVLLLAVGVHAIAGIQLWMKKREARPIAYHTRENIQATAASRTMIVSGVLIGFFVVYHVLDLTMGVARTSTQGFEELNPAYNVTHGFAYAPAALAYIVAMVALGFHLWHGVYSMFGTLGLTHPRYTDSVKKLAAAAATIIALANISVPVAVLAGLVHY